MDAVECPYCEQLTEIGDGDNVMDRHCEHCGKKLVEEAVPEGMNENQPLLPSKADMTAPVEQEVDVDSWVSKIGDYDKQVKYVEEGFWGKVKRYASKVPFAREVMALYYCALDPATPRAAKVTAIGAIAYWILPLDLLPDFIPVAGFADDATAVIIAFKTLSGFITEEHREKAEQFFALNRSFKVVKRPANED
ncbi:YkvA family protein [Paenibacillus sp. J5C_2022]|uniref:YkvA family protein n=1 Tax=Paenibacillus sp. J5C2022 TaxID=2977129 RepID=UPI0021D1C8E8|nr:YkvA family protein [Paenibacillus sp. J5C2022]MCU6709905.1 YkvA family protein [Paenibacillus sp. J5C2022]